MLVAALLVQRRIDLSRRKRRELRARPHLDIFHSRPLQDNIPRNLRRQTNNLLNLHHNTCRIICSSNSNLCSLKCRCNNNSSLTNNSKEVEAILARRYPFTGMIFTLGHVEEVGDHSSASKEVGP